MKTYVVNWHGPFTDEEVENFNDAFGLYLITGKLKSQKIGDIQYCGITERNLCDRLKRHHKKSLVSRDRQYWLGQIESSSRRLQRKDLELVESLVIYFWQVELNERKRKRAPERVVIVNRWFNKDGILRMRKTHIGQHLNDVIFWDGEEWHLGNLKIYQNS